jgi:hypothetical protein
MISFSSSDKIKLSKKNDNQEIGNSIMNFDIFDFEKVIEEN